MTKLQDSGRRWAGLYLAVINKLLPVAVQRYMLMLSTQKRAGGENQESSP